ncbi:uncharacterized protein LOC129807562 [Phlebotomus papatasi]|uniref:uncharacterized protein LOC129807562 n=1 Tax=Phlebotomus papatasi TaxID=29031 RepID=UPI0024844407|nr:uncharacterized protein LOC129807562 [Phlebotomus papatasi]
MIPRRNVQPLPKKYNRIENPKGVSCDWDSPSSSTGTIKRRPLALSVSRRHTTRQDVQTLDSRQSNSYTPEIEGRNCFNDGASRNSKLESNHVPEKCIKSNLKFPRVTWKQEEKINTRPPKNSVSSPVGPPSKVTLYKSQKTPIKDGRSSEHRITTFTFRELFRDFPSTPNIPPPYRHPPPAAVAKQTKRELIELQQGGKPPLKRYSSRIQNEYIMLGPRGRVSNSPLSSNVERTTGISHQCKRPPNSRTILKNLPVRPRKGTVKHMENYYLFDPSVDFINEKQQTASTAKSESIQSEGRYKCNGEVIYDQESHTIESEKSDNEVNLSLPKSISGSLDSGDGTVSQIDKPPPMLAPLSFTNHFIATKSFYTRPFSYYSDGDSGFLSPLTPEEPRFDAPISLLDHCDNIQGYIEIYTDWANYYLERAKSKRKVVDLSADCRDGLLLAEVIEAVTSFKVPDIIKKPKTQQQMVSLIK